MYYYFILSFLIFRIDKVLCSVETYASGILENVTSEIHPLSSLYVFYENSSLTFTHFPIAPDCSSILNTQEAQYPATVTIWKIDQDSKAEWGLLYWKEKITTSCTWDFWGTYKGSELYRSTSIIVNLPTEEGMEEFWNLDENSIKEVTKVPYNLRYYCYWCKNEVEGSYHMVYVKKVRIIRFPDGSIKSPGGSWTRLNKDLWYDQMRYLKIKTLGKESHCPLKMYDIKAAVLSKSESNFVVISIPSLNVQFSISTEAHEVKCKFGDKVYSIVQSMGGYLISIDTGNSNWRGPWEETSVHQRRRKRDNYLYLDSTSARYKNFVLSDNVYFRGKRELIDWEFPLSLRSNLDYAQFRYEQSYIVKQINKNFGLLQKSICDIQYLRWQNLGPPNLAMKVAQYITGSIHSIGSSHFGAFAIQRTEKSILNVELTVPIVVRNGMFKCWRGNKQDIVWAEPVTGILFKDPISTHFSLSANWLPGLNGSAIVPQTNQIILPEITIDHLDTIKQAEAKSSIGLYSDSELSSSSEEFNNYRTQGIPDPSTFNLKSVWTEWLLHGSLSIICGILVTFMIPSILKLWQKLIQKGETKLEETLHLTATRRDFVKQKQNMKPWGT